MPAIRAGMLNTHLRLERRLAQGQDAGGMPRYAWVDVGSVWVQLLEPGASEPVEHDGVSPRIQWRARTHWRQDITSDMRLMHGSQPLYPVGPPVDPDGLRQEIILNLAEDPV